MTTSSYSKFWPWFFFAAAFESLICAVVLFSIPSENGLSLARFGLLAVLLLFSALSLYFGFHTRQYSAALDLLPRTSFVITSALLSLTSSLILFLLRYLDPERLLPVYERLSPLLWFFAVFGIQSTLFLLLLKNGFHPQELARRRDVYRSALFAFITLLLIFLFASITKLGITRDTAYWGEPGVPILGWHFALSILTGFFILLCGLHFSFFQSGRLQNFILPLAIWVAASVLWLTVPWKILQNSFYAPITPPADIPFPYSDAGFYDSLAQSLLIGTDYLGGIPPRPLYVLFLAVLHVLFGQNYIAIITAQTLVLALFPVTLYFLAKKLHSSAAGVTVALFAIFREYLGLWISSNTRVANSKVFTTDFPTALGIAGICLVFIWWFERRDIRSTLVTGGAFGLLLLLRTQSLLILPFVFMLAGFVYQKKTRQWIIALLIFVFTMAATIAPWLIHNYTVTGRVAFDDPRQMAIIFSQYSFTGNLDISQFDFEKASLGSTLIAFTLENPGYVAGFITNHFLNTEIGGLLSLSLIERYDGLFAPVNLYWINWPAPLAWYNQLLLVFYLAILAIGLGAAWHRAGWLGLTPLAINLGYALSNGISRFSSWRYNLPVDWVVYFYFAIGVIEILGGAAILFGAKTLRVFSEKIDEKSTPISQSSLISPMQVRPLGSRLLIVLVFVLIGALPWIAKELASPRYISSQAVLTSQLVSRGLEADEIQGFLSQSNAILMEGRLLYPRMYRRGDGMVSANPWPAYRLQDYPRIGFILLNNRQYNAIFPTRELLDFPHGSDGILLACKREDYLEVRFIAFPNTNYQNSPLTDLCN